LSIGIDLNSFPLSSLPILSVAQVNQILANISAAGGTAPNVLNGLQVIAADRLKNRAQYNLAADLNARSRGA